MSDSYIGNSPSKVPANAITSDEIENATIATEDLANASVTFDKINSADAVADQATAELGASAVKLMTPQRTRQAMQSYFEGTTVDAYTAGVDFTAGVDNSLTPSTAIGSVNNIFVFFDGVYQAKNNLTINSSGDLEFGEAIPLGISRVEVIYGTLAPTGVPTDGSITITKLAAGFLASQAQAEAGTSDEHLMTPLATKQAIDASIVDNVNPTLPIMVARIDQTGTQNVVWSSGKTFTITDTGTGSTRINWDTPMIDADYAINITCGDFQNGSDGVGIDPNDITINDFEFSLAVNNTARDNDFVTVTVWGNR